MANSNNRLKAYVRYDGTGRVIAGSLILQRFKPKVGNWVEIDANECCNYIPGSTTTTTTTAAPECFCYTVDNQTAGTLEYTYTDCGSEVATTSSINADTISIVCSSTAVTGDDGLIITGGTRSCINSEDCAV
tara:strand:+ start:682 stop:1077 length:396 start_codon:yes stop_codon:yes gene_type:complete